MGLGIINLIKKLIAHWESINIKCIPASYYQLTVVNKELIVPKDFLYLYTHVNGMSDLYPNETDPLGFLFYPIEALKKLSFINQKSFSSIQDNIVIFADYLHESWLYGYRNLDEENYEIGIIPDFENFFFITNSLSEFLVLYFNDSDKLYLN